MKIYNYIDYIAGKKTMKKLMFLLALLISVNSFSQIPKDKQLHMAAGFGIGTATTVISVYDTHSFLKAFYWSSAISLTAGIGKELYDVSKGYNFDYKDMACTFAGGFWGYWATIMLMQNEKYPFKYRVIADMRKEQKLIGLIINF